jgi:hypothetical protein
MIIGEERAVDELWGAARDRMSKPRDDRPGQPVYVLEDEPEPGETGLRAATARDLDLLVPACAEAHLEEIGIDPLRRDPEGFRWRTRAQIEEGRSWLWLEDGVIRFKAEVCDARDARPLPAAARPRPGGLPVRPPRERRCDPPVRAHRDAAHDLVPLADLLSRRARVNRDGESPKG